MVSYDVEFHEYATWNWDGHGETNYDFLPYFEEDKETTTPIQDATSSLSPTIL